MLRKAIFLLLLALTLAGCSPLVRREQPASLAWLSLEAGQTIGQTFVTEFDGLAGVQIFLAPQTAGNGEIILHLRRDPQSTVDLAVSSLPIGAVTTPGFYGFYFPPPISARQQYFYALFEITGSSLQIGSAPGETYLDGSLYQDGNPVTGQMAFQLTYSRRRAALGLAREGFFWGGLLLAGAFLFILPGWGLLSALWPSWRDQEWAAKLGLSAGVSLALYPLLILLTDLIGLHLGSGYAWGPPLIGLGIILWRNRKRFHIRTLKQIHFQTHHAPAITLVFLILLIIGSRFWAIRALEIPLWGDSYQHTMIAQLLVDNGGLFESWAPYTDLSTFTYHFGFHSGVAAFHWVTGLPLAAATMWFGQLLNLLAVLALYPLAVKVGKNRWAGVVAVLLAGLLSPMPMTYTNWGRYTQLAGQAILPVAAWLGWEALELPKLQWRSILLAAVVLAGLGLSHFRILVFIVLFFVAYLLLEFLLHPSAFILPLSSFVLPLFASRRSVPTGQTNQTNPTNHTFRPSSFRLLPTHRSPFALRHPPVATLPSALDHRPSPTTFIQLALIATATGLLFLPWLVRLFGGRVLQILAYQLNTPPQALAASAVEYNAIGELSQYLPVAIWLLLPISVAWGFWKRKRGIALLSLWWFLILLAANPNWLMLPGTGAISNFAVLIAAYIPASILIGAAAGWLIEMLTAFHSSALTHRSSSPAPRLPKSRSPLALRLSAVAPAFLILALGIWGARERIADINPSLYTLVTQPDLRAADWIINHTPANARFLVNSFPAFGNTTLVGSDGGWWLPLLAHRATTLPPINYGFEADPWPGYREQINSLFIEIQSKGVTSPEVLSTLASRGVTYVYLGQRQGSVNTRGTAINPQQLAADPHFRQVYHADQVWIFEILPQP